jgi:putative transposase
MGSIDIDYENEALNLSDRKWTCAQCGANHDRDLNAAINIKNEGGSYPVKPVERKSSVRRPKRRTTMASSKQESSRFETQVH